MDDVHPPEFITVQELLAEGWKERQITAALDRADDFGPSKHWFNTTGTPLYYRDRVAVAAFRCGISGTKPGEDLWKKWKDSHRPTSLPVLTFDFHRLADEVLPGSRSEIWELRLAHPRLGRRPWTVGDEKTIIEKVLLAMIQTTSNKLISTREDFEQFMLEHALQASSRLGREWPDDVVVRPALRRSYISRATGPQTIAKFLDAISMVHSGLIKMAQNTYVDYSELLIKSGRLRFDRRSL